MANQLYQQGAAHLLGKSTQIDLLTDTIKILFYTGTFSNSNEFVSDLTGADIVARSSGLAGKAVTNGTFSANNITVSAVSGSAFAAVILYKDSGADGSSPLIAWYDISTYTPTGADISVVFNASGLFAIV